MMLYYFGKHHITHKEFTMAERNTIEEVVADALIEYIKIAELCIETGHGFPAALLLFTIVDAIGSYYEGNKDFIIPIDGEEKAIQKENREHYYILNSKYYKQNLTEEEIGVIYSYYRNKLIHNSALKPGYFLKMDDVSGQVFTYNKDEKRNYVNLKPFYNVSYNAVQEFLKDSNVVIPNSKQGKRLV